MLRQLSLILLIWSLAFPSALLAAPTTKAKPIPAKPAVASPVTDEDEYDKDDDCFGGYLTALCEYKNQVLANPKKRKILTIVLITLVAAALTMGVYYWHSKKTDDGIAKKADPKKPKGRKKKKLPTQVKGGKATVHVHLYGFQ